MRPSFRSTCVCLALTLVLVASHAPAMDSELESFPVSVRHDMDMEYEYDVHTFTLEAQSVVTAVVIASGFHPTLQVMPGEEPGTLASAAGGAGQPLRLTTLLDAGAYRLVVVAEPVWDEQSSYTMAIDAVAASDLGEAITLTPTASAAGSFRFSDPVPVLGTRLPAGTLDAQTAIADLSGGSGKTELLFLDAGGDVIARAPGAVVPVAGATGIVVAGPFVDETVTVRTASAGAAVATERLAGTLDPSSPRAVEYIDRADLHPIDIPSALGVTVEVRSPSAYLDVHALAADGRVVATVEEGDEGFVTLELPAGHEPVASILVSGRGDTGEYTLTARAETAIAVPAGQSANLTVDGKRVVAGKSYRLQLPSAGTFRATSAAGAQLLALAADGSWLGGSQPMSTEEALEVGQKMRVVDEVATDADTTVPDQPELKAGEVVTIEQVSSDGAVAMVNRDGWSWAVFTAGMEPVGGVKRAGRLELELPAGEVQLLVLGDDEGLVVEHVAQLLDLQQESLDDGEQAQRQGADRVARHPLTVADGELVELGLQAPGLERARVRLTDGEGNEIPAAALADGGGLRWLANRSGEVTVEVLGGTEAAVPYQVDARRLAARVSSHELELLQATPLTLRQNRDGATLTASVELPKGTNVLVRLQASEAGRLDLAALGADGSAVAVASTGDSAADEVSLLATVGAGGKLTVVTASEEQADEATLEVTPLDRAPALVLPADDGSRQALERPMAPDFTWAAGEGERKLSDLRGQVVLLEFWASWCAPCRDSLPNVEALHRRYADRGLVVLGVNDETVDVATEAAKELGLTFTTVPDEDDAIGTLYEVDGIPRTIIVGRDGRILGDFDGAANEEPLLRVVTSALKGDAG